MILLSGIGWCQEMEGYVYISDMFILLPAGLPWQPDCTKSVPRFSLSWREGGQASLRVRHYEIVLPKSVSQYNQKCVNHHCESGDTLSTQF